MPPKVVIVGAGHAGGRCALLLRQKGFEGEITLIGKESDPPYERPPLSKDLLTGNNLFESCLLLKGSGYDELGIRIITEETVLDIDRQNRTVRTSKEQTIHYDKLVLATGGTCRTLGCPGSSLDGIHVLRDRKDSEAIAVKLKSGARVFIIGGGFIGLEVAAAAIALDCDVTVIEKEPRLLGRVFPATVSEVVRKLHEAKGVKFAFEQGVEYLSGEYKIESVTLESGEKFNADLAVIGIGIVPETTIAEDANLDVSNGIVANHFCQTTDPNIYAIGDCANAFNQRFRKQIRLESWQNAEQQADIAASHIMGSETFWQSVPWFWSDQHEYNIQMAGFPGGDDTLVQRGDIAVGAVHYFSLEDGKLVGAIAIGEGMQAAKDLRVAQMLIERKVTVSENDLSNDGVALKGLLKR